MTFNIKSLSILLLLAVLVFPACEEFEEFNENPNEPTEVSDDVLLTASLRTAMNTMVTESFLLGNNAAQLTSKTLRTEIDTYNWNAFPTVWEGLYESLTDIHAVEENANETGNEQLEGVAKVWRAFIFATLTNAYGDIPYTEAVGGADNNFTPVYDPQQDIYADLLSELALANTLLSGSGSVSGDIIYGGDASKWQKLANSLRLRLLMTANNRISDAGSQFAAIVDQGNIMSSNDDNATLTYLGGFPNQFPLVPLKTGDFDAVALSQTLLDVLSGYNDPRLMRYARPNNDDFSDASAFTGAVNGANTGECPKNGSRLGVQYWNDPNLTQAQDLGLGQAEGIVMTYAEVEFLLAEAAAKGWISDDIESHYRAGIEASMGYYQVDVAPFGWSSFDDFYMNSGVAYNQVTDIWEQKWVALYFTGLEPYFEVRRWYYESDFSWDGIPFIGPSCQNVNDDVLPMRFLYPGQEQSLNAINYEAAVNKLGSNSINAQMWLVQ